MEDLSMRIFKQKETSQLNDTAVSGLLDFSGSMGGTKIVHAIRCAMLFNETLGMCRVTYSFAGFTDAWNNVHYIFKDFNENISTDELGLRMCNAANMYMSGNADGDSIVYEAERLLKRPEKRKILFVLSDGQPAGGNDGDIYGYTKDVVKQLETQSPIEIMGIGIMSHAVKDIYSQYAVIQQSEQLEEAVLNILKNKIITFE